MTDATPLPAAARSALIVVDMQNGFVHEQGSCAKAGFPVATMAPAVEPCRRAIGIARKAGVPIVFTRYTYRADFKDGGFMLREKFPMLADVKALVDDSENVDIREVEQRNGATLIEVRVAPNDVGKIIGKQGKTIRALRSLARIAGARKNRRYLLEIVE